MNDASEDVNGRRNLSISMVIGIITGAVGLISGLVCILFVHDVAKELMTNDLISWIAQNYDDVNALEFTMRFVGASMIVSGMLGFMFACFCHYRIRYKIAFYASLISGAFGIVLFFGLFTWISTYLIKRSKNMFKER